MLKKTQPFFLAMLLTVAAGCAKESASLPSPNVASKSANQQAPIDPPGGGDNPGGSGDPGPCDVAPTNNIKLNIKRYVRIAAGDNNWTIVTTITPPDGITYGLGCHYVYPFSVDIIDNSTGQSTFASGTYDVNTNQYTIGI